MAPVNRSRTRPVAFLLSLAAAAGLAGPAMADDVDKAPIVLPETPPLVVQGFFAGADGGAAQDLSGIACRPPAASDGLECLVVNDEGTAAQRVVIDRGRLVPGETRTLIGAAPPNDALGSPPAIKCPEGAGKFKEFDGEGVAFAPRSAAGDGFFYVVGSHGCARKKNEFRASSFLLARLPVDAAGKLGPVELSWRVSEALRLASPEVSEKVGKSLEDDNGLNIEGIAALGDRLLFGLRAPSRHEKGYVVSVPVAELFAPGTGEAVGKPVLVHDLKLGEDTGIRDLAALPDGKLLVLSGPAVDKDAVPYALSVYDPATAKLRWLGRLVDVRAGDSRAKAEAVTVLGRDDTSLRVLVLFDGIQNGGPQEYRLRY